MKLMSWLVSVSFCAGLITAVGYSPRQEKKPGTDSVQSDKPTLRPSSPHELKFPNPWPQPLDVPDTDPEEAAWYLAQKVIAGGTDALPALERAALLSGFSIHSSDGKILYSPEEGCDLGLSMLDLDLVIAADLTSGQVPATLADLETHLRAKGFKIPAAQLLGKTVTAWQDNFHPGKYFFSNFMIGLCSRNDGGEVNFEELAPDTEVCAAQLTFLSYVAFGMSAVGENTRNGLPPGVKEDIRLASGEEEKDEPAPGVPPAEEPPPTAEDPPPHGPNASQSTAAGVSLRNLMQAMAEFVSMDWSEYVRQNTTPGSNPQLAILEFIRIQIYRSGLRPVCVGQTPNPLVRTKTKGQKGGNSDLRVDVTLSISSDIRQKYAAARLELPGAAPLAPDGPIDVLVKALAHDENGMDDQALDTPNYQSVGTGKINFSLVGATQKKNLLAKVEPVRRWPTLTVKFSPQAIKGCPFVPFEIKVPVTDWRNSGLYLDFQISVEGHGTYVWKGGRKVVWSVNRMLSDSSLLNTEMPGGALLEGGQVPLNKIMEYTGWTKDPNKGLDETFEYYVRDNYIYTNRVGAGGCAVRDSRRKPQTSFRRYADRKEPAPKDMGADLLQIHEVANTKDFGFMSSFWPIPVLLTESYNKPLNTHIRVFFGTERNSPPPYVKLEDGLITLKGRSKSGSFDLTGTLKELTGGRGKNTVKIHVFWIIGGDHLFSLDKNPPNNDPPPPPPPPNEQPFYAKTQKQFRGGSRLSDLNSPNAKQRRKDELWVDHNSAATCSEIILSDSLPRGVGKG
jgi:hypothetical protein